ncbi:MAG: hypothetical protein WC770_06915 [Phycisphaerae bacterium]|jgi:hypothetical protein
MLTKSWIVTATIFCFIIGGCNKQIALNSPAILNTRQDIESTLASKDVLEVSSCKPAVLALGENLNVEVLYELNSMDSAMIWVRPFVNGKRTGGYSAHHLIPVNKQKENPGVAECWFSFDRPAEINEIRVFMQDTKTRQIVKEISHKINAKWEGTEHTNKPKCTFNK